MVFVAKWIQMIFYVENVSIKLIEKSFPAKIPGKKRELMSNFGI